MNAPAPPVTNTLSVEDPTANEKSGHTPSCAEAKQNEVANISYLLLGLPQGFGLTHRFHYYSLFFFLLSSSSSLFSFKSSSFPIEGLTSKTR